MAIKRWTPFREFEELQDKINRLFSETRFGGHEETQLSRWIPATDIYETEDRITIEMELPGMKKDDIDINMENNILTIKGERKMNDKIKTDNYHRIERVIGQFQRSFTIPRTVKGNDIEANFDNGILSIVLPKAEEAKPKKIQIKID